MSDLFNLFYILIWDIVIRNYLIYLKVKIFVEKVWVWILNLIVEIVVEVICVSFCFLIWSGGKYYIVLYYFI